MQAPVTERRPDSSSSSSAVSSRASKSDSHRGRSESGSDDSDHDHLRDHSARNRADNVSLANHGEPDLDYEQIGAITSGHELDVELEKAYDKGSLSRIESRTSVKHKLSRVFSTASRAQTGAGAGAGGGEKGSGEKGQQLYAESLPLMNLDEGIVGWESEDDPAMPWNFDPTKKWVLVACVSGVTFLTTYTSSILSPAISKLDSEFHNTSTIIGSIVVSVYLLGYVVGPLFIAPLSEIYGRLPVLLIANIFFCCWLLGCALAPNMSSLIVFRFFTGMGGAGCMTLGGSIMGDLFRAEQRGLAMGIWNLGPLVGPTVGPLTGGFIVEKLGWRWDFWICLIVAVVFIVVHQFFNKETSARVLIQRKVVRLSKELGRDDLRSCYNTNGANLSSSHILFNSLVRPTKMLFLSPMIFSLSIYIAFVYGVMYLLFTTIPGVFEESYGFNVGICGLVYLALGCSNIIGWLVVALYSDKSVIRLTKANGGRFEPEMRLTITPLFGLCLPITFFWYGWTAQYKVHWICPILSLMPFGFGMMGLFLPITTYLVDAYPMYAASALAANVISRSLVGAMLPLAGPTLYANLNYGWGNSVLGFISIAMVPVPLLILKYGKRLRTSQNFQL